MSDDLSTSELYAIKLNENNPQYFTMNAGVLFHCTYIVEKDGVKIRKKLSPRARDLYMAICHLGSITKKCWAATDTLADFVGCSTGTISALKEELQMPLEQLNGKPLIIITKKKKSRNDADQKRGTTYDEIKTTHIWPENNAFMATLAHQQPLPLGPLDSSSSNNEPDEGSDSNNEPESPGSGSNIERSNRKQRKKHSVKQTEATAGADSVCDLSKKDSVIDPLMQKAKDAMAAFGCDNNFIKEMSENYSAQQILDGGYYTNQQQKLNKIKTTKFGYLRNSIEQGRKWNNV